MEAGLVKPDLFLIMPILPSGPTGSLRHWTALPMAINLTVLQKSVGGNLTGAGP